jgi:hypothetical protein
MRNTNTCKLGVIILTLAMLTTALAVLPTMGAGEAANENVITTTYTIVGKVVQSNPSGAVSGVSVSLNNSDSTDITKSDGTFLLYVERVTNINTTVKFEHPYFETNQIIVNTSLYVGTKANMQNITLKKLSSISGIVRNNDGILLNDVSVTLTNGTTVWNTTTSASGAYTIYTNTSKINVNIIYSKVGYYENQTSCTITPMGVKNVGTTYLKKITPEPTVKLDGYVQSGSDYLDKVHVSVSRDGTNWISAFTDNRGYYAIYTFSGWLQVKAEKTGYYNYNDWKYVNETDDNRFYLGIKIDLISVGTGILDGVVQEKGGAVLDGATVELHVKDANGTYVLSRTTSSGGMYNFAGVNFGTACELSVSKGNYFTNSTTGVTATTVTRNVDLTLIHNDYIIKGYVRDSANHPIPNATIAMHSQAWIYKVTATSEDPSGYFEIAAFNGTFKLMVDAPGFQGKLVPVTISGADKWVTVNLSASGIDTIVRSYAFSADWKTVTLRENRTLDVDNATLRAFADINFGRGYFGLTVNNWFVDPIDIVGWKAYMRAQGLPEISTANVLAFDKLYYELNITSYDVKIYNAGGDIATKTGAVILDINATYKVVGIPVTNDKHEILFNASYDTETVDKIYNIVLPSGYEMTANTTSSSRVKVTGFTTVKVNTMVGTGVEKMTMTIRKTENGTAKIRLTDGTFYEKNSTYKGYEVIVRMNQTTTVFNSTVKFSASESIDPVGSIQLANYTWDFGDGSTGYGMNVYHDYKTPGLKIVNLTFTETDGNKSYRTAKVYVDEATPTPVINVLYHTIASSAITVNEDNKTSFTGGNSTDMITGTTAGVIQTWQWSWGDGTDNETMTKGGEANINHTYQKPGTYKLKMNVTDVVGHVSANKEIDVTVKDVTKPNVEFQIMNSTYAVVTGCRENITFGFNSTSTDNYDTPQNLTYTWTWGDGSVAEIGRNLTHAFAKVGSFNVTLNVSDKAGNWAIKMVPVSVSLGVRPDLMLYANTFKINPKTIDDGKKVDLSVNFTNKGEASATGVVVTFFIRNSDGTNDRISGTVTLTNKDGTTNSGTLDPKKNATAKLTWKPSGKGNYTIYVTVNCTGEHTTTMFDNNNGATLNTYVKVNASPMIQYAIAGTAIGVFIIGAAVYFFWVKGKTSGGNIDDKRKKK